MKDNPQYSEHANTIGDSLGLTGITYYRSGAFKETYRAIYKSTGIPVALKILPNNPEGHIRLSREIETMHKCNSAFFPRIFEAKNVVTPDGLQFSVLVEEFLKGGSLGDRLSEKTLPKSSVKVIAIGLLEAISTLKLHKCVHRDIKPENIMFRGVDDQPVLVDFGLVRNLTQPSATLTWLPTGPGTPYFAAPEQLNNDKDLIDWRTDQFALGVVVSIASLGIHPYQDESGDPFRAVDRVAARGKIPSDTQKQIIDAGLAVVLKMVRPWPVQRFANLESIKRALETLL